MADSTPAPKRPPSEPSLSNTGTSPVHQAVQQKQMNVVNALVKLGALINTEECKLVRACVEMNYMPM